MFFDGAVSVSAPYDVNRAIDTIKSTYIERYFVHYYKKIFEYSEENLRSYQEDYDYNLDKIFETTSLRDLHQQLTCKAYNIKDTYELFGGFKIQPEHIENLDMPVMMMHAKDDPVC